MKKKYFNLILLSLAFEKQWLKYYFSEGRNTHDREYLKKGAKQLFEFLLEIQKDDTSYFNDKDFEWSFCPKYKVKNIINDFLEWAENEEQYPKCFYKNGLEASQLDVNQFFIGLDYDLARELKLEKFPLLSISLRDTALHENNIKWRQHVDPKIIEIVDENFLDTISSDDTIVIVADIRNSQDLVTYSPNPDFYKENIMKLVNQARGIISRNMGIFDRFTGDGFICYFNKYICDHFDLDYLKTALIVCNEIIETSYTIFQEWLASVRKLPSGSIGLSIGLDSGKISFSETDNHLFAIGVPCVWATRACDAGKANDIVLNNISYHQYLHIFKNIKVDEISSSTKSGESFTVFALDKKWRKTYLDFSSAPLMTADRKHNS